MNVLSVCSGIGAPECAWTPLGFKFVGASEIEPFPSAVLASHYPDVPNFGDLNNFDEWNIDDSAISVIVGGTPCQAFSVAGLRRGLDDSRGNLSLTFIRLCQRVDPEWIVWENVPGVLSSNGGRDWNSFTGALSEIGYSFAWRILDAQFFGVPQRRRRVFLVGHRGDWRYPAAVLFEPQGLRGDIKKSGKAGEKATPAIEKSTGITVYENYPADSRVKVAGIGPTVTAWWGTGGGNTPIALNRMRGFGDYTESNHASALKARDYKDATDLVLRQPTGSSFQSSGQFNDFFVFCDTRDGNTTIHSWDIKRSTEREKEICLTVLKNRRKSKYGERDGNALSFENLRDLIPDLKKIELSKLIKKNFLRKEKDGKYDLKNTKNSAGIDGIYRIFLPQSSAFPTITATQNRDYIALEQIFGDTKEEYKKEFISKVLPAWLAKASNPSQKRARRIMPIEAERLQGFPDDYTNIIFRGKFASDSQRYKALGNSMAVPVLRWIGERILQCDRVEREQSEIEAHEFREKLWASETFRARLNEMPGETTREKLAALIAIIDPLETPILTRAKQLDNGLYHEWNTDTFGGGNDDDA